MDWQKSAKVVSKAGVRTPFSQALVSIGVPTYLSDVMRILAVTTRFIGSALADVAL